MIILIDVIELECGPYWGNIGRVLFLQVYGPICIPQYGSNKLV